MTDYRAASARLLIFVCCSLAVGMHMFGAQVEAMEPAKPLLEMEVLGEGRVLLDGKLIVGTAALEAKLIELAQQEVRPEIHIKPPNQDLINYQALLSVLEAAQKVGMKIGFVVSPLKRAP